MPQSTTPGAAPQPAPLSFVVSCDASGWSWPLTASKPAELAAYILQCVYGVSYPVAEALAHAAFTRGHGEYGQTLSIRREEG